MRFIYFVLNTKNGKVYVGQTNNINNRISSHKHDALKRKYNLPFHNAIRKYGIDCFEVYVLGKYHDYDIDVAEKYWISFYNSTNDNYGYNLESGGCFNKTMSEKTKNKLSRFRKIYFSDPENNPMYGKHHSEETKLKISKANKGKCYNSIDHMNNLHMITSNLRRGSQLSKETKIKISNSRKGFKHSEQSKNKMSLQRKGELNPAAKLTWEIVRNIRKDYNSGIKGKRLICKYNISETNIYRILKGIIWKEKND